MIKMQQHINLVINALLMAFLISCGGSKKIQAPDPETNDTQFKEVFHEANSEKLIEHYEKAITLFNKCLVINPNSAASHYALAEIYDGQNNTEKAIEYAKNAFNIDKENKWYAAFLADSYFKIGDYRKSSTYYDLVVNKHDDRNIDHQSKLAQSLIYSDQKEKAIEALNKMELVTGSSPMTSLTKHDLYLELGKEKEADDALLKLFDENATDVSMLLEVMDYFLQTRQLNKALLSINRIKKIDQHNAKAKVGEAEIELSKGNIDQTFVLLNEAMVSAEVEEERKLMILQSLIGMSFDARYSEAKAVNKNLSVLLNNLRESLSESSLYMSLYGEYLMQNNHKDSAKTYFKKAVTLSPDDFDSWMNLLDASHESKQYKQAVTDANEALNIFPNQPVVYLLKGIAEYELNNFSSAQETFFLGKELVIDDEALLAEFKYYIVKNDWALGNEDQSAFERLLKDNPQNARYFFGYAEVLHQKKDKKALEYAKKAVEIDPRMPEYSSFYANLLFDEKNYVTAQKMIERAIAHDGENPRYLEKYGDIVFFLGDVNKAVEVWEQTYKIKPTERLQKKINSKTYHD